MNLASYIILAIVLLLLGWAVYKLIKRKGICACGTVGSEKKKSCNGCCAGCFCGCEERKEDLR